MHACCLSWRVSLFPCYKNPFILSFINILSVILSNKNGRLKFERQLQVALSFPRTRHSMGSFVVCCIGSDNFLSGYCLLYLFQSLIIDPIFTTSRYFGIALFHLPCYGIYLWLVKAKVSMFSKMFPHTFIR